MKIPEETEELETPLHQTTRLLQTLLSSAPKTHHFKSKWSSISTKLLSLSSHLSSLSSPQTNPLSLDLLNSLSLTLSSSLSLLTPCLSPSPLPNGKLKTQNDVDSLLTRLDRHLADLHVILRDGAVSLSPSSSKREIARNLITRLQIGTTESKNSAMDSLLTFLQENEKNILIAVAQGVVPVLVRLLDSSSSYDAKEKTVISISIISAVDSTKHALLAEGLVLINNLLRVVESGSGFGREKACVALRALANSKENARAVGSRGGITSLLAICQAGTPSSQAAAAGVLRDLSLFEEVKESFIEENAVRILLALFASGTSLAQENSIGCLCNLVVDDFQLKLLVAREGGIESLKSYWDSVTDAKRLKVAVELVRHLATLNPIAEILYSNGFLNRVVSVLSCGVLEVRVSAAKAVYEMGFNTKTRKELGELGCTAPLVRMMEGKSGEERESAAKALSNLMGLQGNRSVFRKEERGVVVAVQLLDPSTRDLDKKYPIALLASLVHSKKCRKQMVATGASGFLQKLVEMDVEGAKKLLESLGKGKIWGVFARP